MPSSHLILCRPLLLLPPIPPRIRVFSNESTLRIKWPKYWSFSFSIIPSNEYPGLISFRMDWLDLLAVQGTLKSLLQHHSSKASVLHSSAFFTVQLSHPYMTTGKTIALTRRTFDGKVMSLLLNMLSRLVITFLPKLIEFCQENTLVIANTLFQQHKRRLYTWTVPDGQHQNQIDYILCSQRWRCSIQSAKTRPGADCGSDHELLIAKFRLKLKEVGKTTRPFRYDLNQIPYDYTVEVRNRFKGLELIECLMNYGQRFMTLCRRQGSRPSPWKRNAKKQNGCLRRPYK